MNKLKLIYAIGVLSALFTAKNATAQFWTRSAPNLYPSTLTDKVGIGMTNPYYNLDVNGGFRVGSSTNYMKYYETGGNGLLELSPYAQLFFPNDQFICRHSLSQEGIYHKISLHQYQLKNQLGDNQITFGYYSGDAFFKGKVGIGTSYPSVAKLQVTSYPMPAIGISPGTNGLMVLGDTNTINMALDKNDIQVRAIGTGGSIVASTLFENFYGGNVQVGANAAPVMFKASNGYFGIGTNNPLVWPDPQYPLDVIKHTSSAIASFDGGNSMFISLKENGVYRGYIGSYSGGAADVDFGTGAGNASGNVNLTIQAAPKLTITSSGNVGIGTTTPAYKLDVCGTIRAKEVRVETGWCDYVFANDYKLPALSDVENYIKENKHLPNVTAGPVIENEGLDVGKVSSQMIRKIEELTLYVIEQEKVLNNLKAQNADLESKVNSLVLKGGN